MKAIKLKDLIAVLDIAYPPSFADSWDKVGLHFGDVERPIYRILTALDISDEVINEAIDLNIDTILVHHPPLFHAIERFDLSNQQIKIYEKIIKHDLNVFAMHTNLDYAHNGMNDWLADRLSLTNISPLFDETSGKPSLARVGVLQNPLNRQQVIQHIKQSFNLEKINVIESNPKDAYQKIAIIGGSGSSMLSEIKLSEPDIFVTGDITYHVGQSAENEDFMTIDAGHYIESIFNEKMMNLILTYKEDYNWDIEVFASKINTNPFKVE